MYSKEERKAIANTIIQQMGGFSRIRAMVNGRDFLILDAGVQFTFSGKRGINKCLVKLNDKDLYDMEFWYFNKRTLDCTMVAEFNNLYFDMLISTFEEITGLYLSL